MPAGQPRTKTPKTKRAASQKEAASRGVAVRKSINTGTMAAAESVDPNKPLTEKQRLFAQNYAKGDSIPNAMARAGYSTAQYSLGYRMIKMPNVIRVIDEERRAFEAANEMSRKRVMEMLMESYEFAKLSAEPATMVSAAREIGKMCGYYEPRKVDVNVNVQGAIMTGRLNALSDADLLKLIESSDPTALLEGPNSAAGDVFDDGEGLDSPEP